MTVPSLLRRASLRHYLRHRLQTALAVLGVAVGVAAWVSVHTAAAAARDAFDLSAAQAFGEASHRIVTEESTLPESLYVELRTARGVRRAAPVLDGRVRLLAGELSVTAELVGIDPLAEADLRPGGAAAADGGLALLGLVGDRTAAVLPDALAARLGLSEGDGFTVQRPDGERALRVLATVSADALPLGEDTVLVDLSAAQAVLGLPGRLARIDLRVDDAQARALREWLPFPAQLHEAAAQARAVDGMTRAYRLNLQALSLLTLLVGVLLVYSTLTRFVVQRRVLFARLHALGVTAAMQRRLVLGEAVAMGLAGAVLGAVAGSVLARWLVVLVAGNISDLYFRVQVQSVALQPAAVALGVALGTAAAVLGAVVALHGLRAGGPQPPRPAAPLRPLAAAAATVLLAALLLWLTEALVPALLAVFLVALAGTLLLPLTVRGLCAAALAGPAGRRLPMRMTLRATAAALPRTRVALAGLALAVAAVVAMDTMIGNFRASVAQWLEAAVPGDLTVSADAAVYPNAADADLPGLARALAERADVARVSGVRTRALPGGEPGEQLRALDAQRDLPRVVHGRAGEAFRSGEGVLVSEPLAQRRGLSPGDPLTLALAEGDLELPVLGVVRDYVSDRGTVLIALERYRQASADAALTGLAVYARDDPGELAAALRHEFSARPGLVLNASATLRERTLEVFDRTFTVTRVLRVLAAAVAFLGIFGTLLALLLDRQRLHRALRAVGMPAGTLRALAVLETGVLGLATAMVALPLGLVLSALLVFVVNRRAFGWGMQFEPLAGPLLAGTLLALLTALAAGAVATHSRAVRAAVEGRA